MNIPFFSTVKEPSVIDMNYTPSMCKLIDITEKFVGEVDNENIKFPTNLGVKHPFDFRVMENLYKKFGFFAAVVDKYVDFVVGPGFYIECKDERAKTIIEDFMKDINFDSMLRKWTKEALVKGSGFLEIGGDGKKGIEGLKLLNANYMYVVRDKFGVIESYNQYVGEFKKNGKVDMGKVIPFKLKEIAHVPFNVVGDEAYGMGIGYQAMSSINNLLTQEQSMHMIMNRKANSPLHAKLGKVDGSTKIIPKSEDVTAFGKNMEIMHNKTDWATDPLVEFSVIDFGNIGDKYDKVLEYDLNMLIYCFQIPGVLLGMANVPEGLAGVQMEAFQRRIQSIQAELEKVIENQIFDRVLEANGFMDVDVEFEWGTPNVLEVEGRMALVKEMISSPMVNPAMKSMLEDEMINLLKFDKDEWEKLKLEQEAKEEEERKRLEAQPQPIVPGQNKGFPQKVEPKKEQPKQPKPEEILEPVLKEITKNKEDFEKQFKEISSEMKKEIKTEPQQVTVQLTGIKEMDEKNVKLGEEVKVLETEKKQLKEEKTIEDEKNTKLRLELKQEQIEAAKERLESTQKISKMQSEIEEKELLYNMNDIDKTKKLKEGEKKLKEELEEMESKIKKKVAELDKIENESIKKDEFIAKLKDKLIKKIKKIKLKKKRIRIKKPKETGLISPLDVLKMGNSETKEGLDIKDIIENYEYKKPCAHCEENMDDMNDIEEWLGFSYNKYLQEILIALKGYGFDQIKAVNEIQLKAGYLSGGQVNTLRKIMDTGFKKGQSITEMVKAVDKKVDLKDLYRLGEDGNIKIGASGLPILSKRANNRAVAIVRSEVTRIANMGAVAHYKEGGIQQIKWVASFGSRTCPTCEGLDNQIFEINNHPAIPQHPMCRCTLSPVVELK